MELEKKSQMNYGGSLTNSQVTRVKMVLEKYKWNQLIAFAMF